MCGELPFEQVAGALGAMLRTALLYRGRTGLRTGAFSARARGDTITEHASAPVTQACWEGTQRNGQVPTEHLPVGKPFMDCACCV